MALHASELSNILEQSISKYYANLNVDEIGTVLTIGDGIARVYGLGGQFVVATHKTCLQMS